MSQDNKQMREQNTETANELKTTQLKLNTEDTEEKEIDLLDLFYALLDKWHMILLCFCAGALLLNAFSYFCIKPTYESTAKLYIVSASEDSVVNLTDLNLGASLTSDYSELMLSYPVLNQVISRLGLDMNYKQLAGMIALNNPSDTRVLRITVTSTDPQLACDIANMMAEVAVDYLPATMSTHAPNIAQDAKVAEGKSDPSYLKYTIIGALLGTVICCAYIIISHMMDDTIHTPEDMEKYFGIVPLTSIPESDMVRQEDDEDAEQHSRRVRKGKHRS